MSRGTNECIDVQFSYREWHVTGSALSWRIVLSRRDVITITLWQSFTVEVVLVISVGNPTIRHIHVKKVKCTLLQALRLCTGRQAHRGSRGIALLFHDHGTRRGWGVSVTHRPLFTPPTPERPGTHCIGGWVGPRAGLDGCGKSRPHRDSIPEPSSQ